MSYARLRLEAVSISHLGCYCDGNLIATFVLQQAKRGLGKSILHPLKNNSHRMHSFYVTNLK